MAYTLTKTSRLLVRRVGDGSNGMTTEVNAENLSDADFARAQEIVADLQKPYATLELSDDVRDYDYLVIGKNKNPQMGGTTFIYSGSFISVTDPSVGGPPVPNRRAHPKILEELEAILLAAPTSAPAARTGTPKRKGAARKSGPKKPSPQ